MFSIIHKYIGVLFSAPTETVHKRLWIVKGIPIRKLFSINGGFKVFYFRGSVVTLISLSFICNINKDYAQIMIICIINNVRLTAIAVAAQNF